MDTRQRLLAALTAGAVSAAGLGMIAEHEGYSQKVYADPALGWAVPTVCWGHTATAKRGGWYSDAQCLDLLQKDATTAYRDVQRLFPGAKTQGEVDAYTSLVFNVGASKLEGSTMRRLFLQGDRLGACKQFGRWVYSGGQKMRGLVTRRAKEATLCLRDLQ